jgi:hypothetical protein
MIEVSVLNSASRSYVFNAVATVAIIINPIAFVLRNPAAAM